MPTSSKEFLLKIMRQLPSAPCYPYPVELRRPHVPIIPQHPPGGWQARINDHWGIGHDPDPFKRDCEALYGDDHEQP